MEITKCRFDFSPVAMGEPDPCREPLPRKSRYGHQKVIELLQLRGAVTHGAPSAIGDTTH